MTLTNLSESSKDFRLYFLLRFTEELIKHTKIEDFTKLENVIKKKSPEKEHEEEQDPFKDFQMSIMHENPTVRKIQVATELKRFSSPMLPRSNTYLRIPSQRTQQMPPMQQQNFQQSFQPKQAVRRPLSIPDYPLPPTVRHIRPVPMPLLMDLGKLNPLLQEQGVASIECNGTDVAIIAKGQGGSRTTNIMLNREEVDQIIQAFSLASKIPLHDGVFKAAVGNLLISAIVSEIIGSQFIISKISQQSGFRGY